MISTFISKIIRKPFVVNDSSERIRLLFLIIKYAQWP